MKSVIFVEFKESRLCVSLGAVDYSNSLLGSLSFSSVRLLQVANPSLTSLNLLDIPVYYSIKDHQSFIESELNSHSTRHQQQAK